MAESAVDRSDDGRLRELLAVEKRLQDIVRAAEEDAASRIAGARTASGQRLATARQAAEQTNSARAREERAAHEAALAAIGTTHRAAVAAMTDISDRQVDELARWALEQVMRPGEGAV